MVKIAGIQSSYRDASGLVLDISALKSICYLTEDTFEALKRLNEEVKNASGTLSLSDVYRSWAVQKAAHDAWLSGKRSDFAAAPGESFHMAGRAIDIDVYALNFAGVRKENALKKLWSISRPLGWRPIIARPDMRLSECWHFEYPGPWSAWYDRAPNPQVAKCAILDAGQWDPFAREALVDAMFVQTQLVRVLGEALVVDGIIGRKTKAALERLHLHDVSVAEAAKKLCTL